MVPTLRLPDAPELVGLVLEQSRSALAVTDENGVLLEANRASARLLRLPRESLVGCALASLVAPEGRADVARTLLLAFGGDGEAPATFPVTLADGRALEVRSLGVRDGGAGHLLALRPTLPRRFQRQGVDVGGGPAVPSRRELEIVRLMANGLTGELIAEELTLSPETVRTHLRNVMGKLGARTRPHLVALAMQDGWVDV